MTSPHDIGTGNPRGTRILKPSAEARGGQSGVLWMLKEKVALHAADLGRSLHEGAPRHSPARFQGLMFAVARYGLLLDDIAERLRVTPGVIGRSA